jgi:hypothetical protein
VQSGISTTLYGLSCLRTSYSVYWWTHWDGNRPTSLLLVSCSEYVYWAVGYVTMSFLELSDPPFVSWKLSSGDWLAYMARGMGGVVIIWFSCSAGEVNSLLLGIDYATVVWVFRVLASWRRSPAPYLLRETVWASGYAGKIPFAFRRVLVNFVFSMNFRYILGVRTAI